jgi:hypothetical protein
VLTLARSNAVTIALMVAVLIAAVSKSPSAAPNKTSAPKTPVLPLTPRDRIRVLSDHSGEGVGTS